MNFYKYFNLEPAPETSEQTCPQPEIKNNE